MNSVEIYWVVIGLIAFVLVLLSLREVAILWRMAPGHPDHGLYWFNTLFLVAAGGAVVWGGFYVDGGRQTFEALLATPPSARYAIERNPIIHDTTWIYVTSQSENDVRTFYRNYAKANQIVLIEDDRDVVRMSFALPSGNLFLTFRNEGEETVLYFSRLGEVRTVTE